MKPEVTNTFLTSYLKSLKEESRDTKHGRKYGFDHIILKIAEAQQWIPLRIPYYREDNNAAPVPKKEAEHGEDFKFITKDRAEIVVFVLKGKKLTYANWTRDKFDFDIRRAVQQDLTSSEFSTVNSVRVILAYNKDENEEGIEEYERLIKSLPTKIGDSASLTFERWNLTSLTDKVSEHLIGSPALLPERFFSQFTYICSQVGDFEHGSDHWRTILIPDWKELLDDLLTDPVSVAEIQMVSVALSILHAHGKDHPSWETGWIELLEWSMLALWRVVDNLEDAEVKKSVHTIWVSIYLEELLSYYVRNEELLTSEDSLCSFGGSDFSQAISSYLTYWHMARLGVLLISLLAIRQSQLAINESENEELNQLIIGNLDRMLGMILSNTSSMRPMLDIHHIELFMLWYILLATQRKQEFYNIVKEIHERLLFRRLGSGGVRLIDQSNSWEHLLEHIATGGDASKSFGRSSYLIQMLLEICAGDDDEYGNSLAEALFNQHIAGENSDGSSLDFPEKIDLYSWVPPEDWGKQILRGDVADQGVCQSINSYYSINEDTEGSIIEKIRQFIRVARENNPHTLESTVPMAVLLLACIRHKSPVPPQLWRCQLDCCNEEPQIEV